MTTPRDELQDLFRDLIRDYGATRIVNLRRDNPAEEYRYDDTRTLTISAKAQIDSCILDLTQEVPA